MIGAKQRGKRRAIIETLKDHKKPTVQAFIRRNILPGTTVYSDGHKSYIGLEKMKGINPPYKVIFFFYPIYQTLSLSVKLEKSYLQYNSNPLFLLLL